MIVVVFGLALLVVILAAKSGSSSSNAPPATGGTSTGTPIPPVEGGATSLPPNESIPALGATALASPATSGGSPTASEVYRGAAEMSYFTTAGAGQLSAGNPRTLPTRGVINPVQRLQEASKELAANAAPPTTSDTGNIHRRGTKY